MLSFLTMKGLAQVSPEDRPLPPPDYLLGPGKVWAWDDDLKRYAQRDTLVPGMVWDDSTGTFVPAGQTQATDPIPDYLLRPEATLAPQTTAAGGSKLLLYGGVGLALLIAWKLFAGSTPAAAPARAKRRRKTTRRRRR